MKQSKYPNGMIPTSDDFDFTERSKQYAIEQTRYDFLDSRGVIMNSGMTAGHATDPLRVYLSGVPPRTVNIYSGVAYDAYEGRSRRIWVPDNPSDIPANMAVANSNHDNVDMPDETLANDFSVAFRPARTILKTFAITDASGYWYVCIRYDDGEYDPITIEADGHQEDSKTYDSYVLEVSTKTAVQLTATTGYPWQQLATLYWDSLNLIIESDDRTYSSATITLEETAVARHQDFLHENCIVSEDHTKLGMTINNVGTVKIELSNIIFTTGEGCLVNGYLVTQIASDNISFDPTMLSGIYYCYIDNQGLPRASLDSTVAFNNCTICSVYYDATNDRLQLSPARTNAVVRDRRMFGSIGHHQLNSAILGENYQYLDDLKIKELSNQSATHRVLSHGNGLMISYINSTGPYPRGAGSLGVNVSGASVVVNEITSGDVLQVGGMEVVRNSSNTSIDFTGVVAGDYIIYARYDDLAPQDNRYYILERMSYAIPVDRLRYPVCKVTWDGVSLNVSSVTDMRVFGTTGYYNIQKAHNASGYNVLPQLTVSLEGNITLNNMVQAGFVPFAFGPAVVSDRIYLTDDYSPTNYAGGGTSSGKSLYTSIPIIRVYPQLSINYITNLLPELAPYIGNGHTAFEGLSWYQDVIHNLFGYYLADITANSFRIVNRFYSPGASTTTFFWVAIGPPWEMGNYSILKGGANPTY